ncbi:hypothetical protein EDB81DRAFT_916693 [Dactylonectria macrodidyma]|uniref:Uncharacterized protein n=1 Tax=Dactylonectria macrodidyma TaxID=307937 RepID=A0A9P9DC96_9HYPO|nr:hypothetical protein EDB81DRAFT_916693 [Dactylonectria macrodidyma]
MSVLGKLKNSARLSAIAGVVGMGSFQVWSRNCVIESKPEGMDTLLQSPLYHRLNPVANPAIYDRCTRYVDISQIKPELLDDARSGGPKLVNAFSGGVWGALGFRVQHKYLESKYKDEKTAHQVWDVAELLEESYEQGTEFVAHFNVLRRTPSSILFRCGDFPFVAPNGPRAQDSLIELRANLKPEEQRIEFQFDSVIFQGLDKIDHVPPPVAVLVIPVMMTWAHQQYTKALVETGVRNVLR